MPPKEYRSKPVIIQAMQLSPTSRDDILKWMGEHNYIKKTWDPVNVYIRNEHGEVVAEPGDWVIKGTRGEFYPCKHSTFIEKYAEVVK